MGRKEVTMSSKLKIKYYRKKPVAIEAVQLTRENALEVLAWINSKATDRLTQTFDNGLSIATLEGVMKANYGDYIVKGVKGEFYPVREDIFEQTYEEITNEK